MASRIIQFPVRNAFAPIRSHDSLARDTQYHAARIAEQVEHEIARKAQRMSVGLRIQLADAPHPNVIMMPVNGAVRNRPSLLDKALGVLSSVMNRVLGR